MIFHRIPVFSVSVPFLLILVTAGIHAGEDTAADSLPARGVVVPDVRCADDPGFSYALYLPSAYTGKRRWPVLYAFSPTADGAEPVRLLAPAAERYGYIVAGSNDSRNGPWKPIHQAQRAMLRDVDGRFAVQPKRSYATGFSGGARAALGLALVHPKKFAGVILCGAVEFLELAAMMRGLIPEDRVFTEAFAATRIDLADALRKSGEPLPALRGYRQTAELMGQLKTSGHLDPEMVKLAAELGKLETVTVLEKLEAARAYFITASRVCPGNPVAAYNAACASARLGKDDEAIELLADAAVHFFDQIELLRTDSDLDGIRGHPDFKRIAETIARNAGRVCRRRGISSVRLENNLNHHGQEGKHLQKMKFDDALVVEIKAVLRYNEFLKHHL